MAPQSYTDINQLVSIKSTNANKKTLLLDL